MSPVFLFAVAALSPWRAWATASPYLRISVVPSVLSFIPITASSAQTAFFKTLFKFSSELENLTMGYRKATWCLPIAIISNRKPFFEPIWPAELGYFLIPKFISGHSFPNSFFALTVIQPRWLFFFCFLNKPGYFLYEGHRTCFSFCLECSSLAISYVFFIIQVSVKIFSSPEFLGDSVH